MQRHPKHRRLLECAELNSIKAFIPPASAVNVARERTEGMVNYFWTAVRYVSFITAYDYVQRLASSAYLQGVEDSAVAMAIVGANESGERGGLHEDEEVSEEGGA